MIDSPDFKKAKAFSDFIAFHVRIQFVFIIAFLVAAPVVRDLNAALRGGGPFESSAGPVDKVAVVALLLSALWMGFLTLRVVWRFVALLSMPQDNTSQGRKPASLLWKVPLFLLLAVIDVLMMAAVFWTGAERIAPILGFNIQEVPMLFDEMSKRGCVAILADCI